jgi:hypothetical protein
MIVNDNKHFYVIIAKGDHRYYRHLSEKAARKEAERLQKVTGKRFWIAETILKAVSDGEQK